MPAPSAERSDSAPAAWRADSPDAAAVTSALGCTPGGAAADAGARFAWLDRENPHGRAIVYLATAPDRPTAVLALVPRRLRHGDATVTGAAIGVLTGTPAQRRAMLRLAAIELARGELELIYALPRAAETWPMASAGAVPVATLRRYVRPRGLGRLDRAPRRWRRARRFVTVEPLDTTSLPRLGELACAMPAGGTCPDWDADLLRWRYGSEPGCARELVLASQDGRALAVMAVRRAAGRSVWIEALICSPGHEEAALDAATAEAGDATVELGLCATEPMKRALLGRGFAAREPRELQVITSPASSLRSALLAPGAWSIAAADADLSSR